MVESIEFFGKYTLLERVAVGGMAEIYRAKTVGLGGFEKVLAVKRLHPQFGKEQDIAQMLVDEARIAVHLTHPNIAQIFDLGCIDGQYFIAMEFIDGVDLHQISKMLRERGETIATPALLFIMAEALGGLHYAHTRADADGKPLQIVHRDVSPQNIMISHEGEAKLVDFGIAKAELSSQDETRQGIIKGKFYYMSPEQAYGHHIDARTDVFAAGMVLYELLAGRNPYQGVDEARLLKAVRQADFAPIFASGIDIAPELAEIITRATRRDPQQRFGSALEMQAALMACLDGLGEPYRRMELAQYMRDLLGGRNHEGPAAVMSRVDYQADEASMIFEPGSSLLDELEELEKQDAENPFREEEPTRLWGADGPRPPGHIRDSVGRAQPHAPEFAPPTGADDSGDARFAPPGPSFLAEPPIPGADPTMALSEFPSSKTSQTTLPLYDRLIPPKYRKASYMLAAACAVMLLLSGVLAALVMGESDDASAEDKSGAMAQGLAGAGQGAAGNSAEGATVDVQVVSEPVGAQVSVDGESVGVAPLTLSGLSVREAYEVSVSYAGFKTLARTVQPTPNPGILRFKLQPAGGVLKVTTYPSNAEIEIDGQSYGRSPVDVAGISPGDTYKLVATLEDGRTVSRSVTWDPKAERVMKISLDFEPAATQKSEPKAEKRPSTTRTSTRARRPRRKSTRKTSKSGSIDLFQDKKPKKAAKPEKSKKDVLNIWDD